MKVLLATSKPFAVQAVQRIQKIIESAGHSFTKLENYTDKAQLLDAVRDMDAVIIRSDLIDQEVMDAASNLKIVVRAGAGYDNVDLEVATAHNICVMNTPGQNANAVAELVFGMIIFMQRNRFDGSVGREIKDRKLGLYAFGNVAKMVAKIARGFDMPVYAYSPTLTHDDLRKEGEYGVIAAYSNIELFQSSDFISLHMPLLDETRDCVNYKLLSYMPEDGMLINTARKELLVEEDLIRLMEERPLFQYATDVKPDRHEEFLAKFPNRYFATPRKSGAQTTDANINSGLAAAKQIVAFFNNGDECYRVN
ncbi:MAG: 3-phosphoglycerate dehydrogenase [Bacteroidetes bacterium GWD2_45_23]|nr:MAG: 3-phosphoglycerate dehydrogenase [Bacteroidetes bacterium GWC2_46_850]OFX69106.1 MAG: 3-phosphoglycerate dehydrogenase [Bacteroidetes bacterium GWC1_47_7]OFX87204.1 MAG: 3-phosphoglycerate dehydrogenase [Bacteroidetes bacterium GWD2_45_23]HAR38896.1 3-phosphoglycerate dehydrogenase [Porphyromonadaceae bacterium]HBB01782.1 3-phosphoglycerate dehydrogenase [Porphyromonadaceae bacterium]